MLKFRQFINAQTPEIYYLEEAAKEGKNTHLEHLEDAIWNKGVIGAVEALRFLQSMRDQLAGVTPKHGKITLTTKWDGAPAIFAGIDPETGKFFVGTKGVFAKKPKLNFTDQDIDRNHPGAGLNAKLKIALRELAKLGIKNVIQGDMMFTKNDLQVIDINGEKMLTFQPNTILYAVPVDSAVAKQMKRAKLGIIWHTSYSGRSIPEMKATYKVNISQLNHTPDVWFRDATLIDATGAATFNKNEAAAFTKILSKIGKLLNKVNVHLLNQIASVEAYQIEVKRWNNKNVRDGISIGNTTKYVNDMIKFIENTPKMTAAQQQILSVFKQNRRNLALIFDLQKLYSEAKHILIAKFQKISSMSTFLSTEDGFKVTSPEGVVAIHQSGNVYKLVDRLEFSKANFTGIKSWK